MDNITLTVEEYTKRMNEQYVRGFKDGVEVKKQVYPKEDDNHSSIQKMNDEYLKNRMFYVDYENLPKYSDVYEKAPWWMRPGINIEPTWYASGTSMGTQVWSCTSS